MEPPELLAGVRSCRLPRCRLAAGGVYGPRPSIPPLEEGRLMLGYIIRRALYAVPILIGVCLATFLLFYVVVSPTQLARRNLSSKNPTRQEIQDWLQQHGYDRPLTVQFRDHMLNLALFRFGNS